MIPFDRELSRCRWPDGGCGRRILWTITEAGNRQAVDAKPSDEGSIAVYRSDPRRWVSRVLAKQGALPLWGFEHRFKPHAETCPKVRAASAAAEVVTPEIPGLLPGAQVLDLSAARRRRSAAARARPP